MFGDQFEFNMMLLAMMLHRTASCHRQHNQRHAVVCSFQPCGGWDISFGVRPTPRLVISYGLALLESLTISQMWAQREFHLLLGVAETVSDIDDLYTITKERLSTWTM